MTSSAETAAGFFTPEPPTPATPTNSTLSLSATSTTHSSKYQYEPIDDKIDSIRILVLHPATNIDPQIRCSLVHRTFREKPVYEALSYMWGSDDPTNLIYMNGIQYYVRENLYHALRGLRREVPRNLWVDAVCIDQENLKERACQVNLMDFIYTRASTVLVWLGSEIRYRKDTTTTDFPTSNHVYLGDWKIALYQHPYWRRLWVVQEIGLARTLHVCIGVSTMEWDKFVTFVTSPFGVSAVADAKEKHLHSTGMRLIHQLSQKRLGRHDGTNRLEVLLEDFEYALCQERRDKIYGLLGLAHDCHNGLIRVDYIKGHYELYSEIIWFFLKVRFLASNKVDRSMRLAKFSRLLHRLLETSYLERDHLCPPSKTVQVRGAIVSQVLHIGPTYEEMISSREANKKWTASFADYDALPQDLTRRRETNEAYMGTLLDMTSQDLAKIHNIYPNDAHQKFWSRGIRLVSPWIDEQSQWAQKTTVEYSPAYLLQIQTRDVSKLEPPSNFISTSTTFQQPRMFLGAYSHTLGNHSRLGLVPSDALIGDYICQFWETDAVALLRKEGDVFRIIGRVDLCRGILEELKPSYVPWNGVPDNSKQIDIQMDLDVLSFLTC